MQEAEYQNMYQVEEAHWWFLTRKAFAQKILAHFLKPQQPSQKILDVGCGTGGNWLWLRHLGQVSGIDQSPQALHFCQKRGFKNMQLASAQHMPFNNQEFEGLTLFDVLYHQWVQNENEVIKEAYRVLKPGGWILINDSASKNLNSAHDQFVMGRKRFALEEMTTALSQNGFSIVYATYWNFFLYPLVWLVRNLKKNAPPETSLKEMPYLLNKLFLLLLGCERLLVPWLRLPKGSSILVLAKKKA